MEILVILDQVSLKLISTAGQVYPGQVTMGIQSLQLEVCTVRIECVLQHSHGFFYMVIPICTDYMKTKVTLEMLWILSQMQ